LSRRIGGNIPPAEPARVIERVRAVAREPSRDPGVMTIVACGVVSLRDRPTCVGRRPVFGSLEEVREDVERYRQSGLTELLLDLDFDERAAGAPGALPHAALRVPRRLLAALAPSA
jgi:hypothetical protein